MVQEAKGTKVVKELYNLFRLYPSISTDTRNILPGSLFFALKGERFNGNVFAQEALEKGAAYAVVDEAPYAVNDRCILVGNVLESLQALARHHRNQLRIPVLGITGSNGKTTTKELVHAVLSGKFNVWATKGNLNNHIGVPLTLLGISSRHEIAIVEMGANHRNEIALLCSIALPTHGLITNIGKAHLEGFGGPEGVLKGKKELYDSLASRNGTAFVNADNSLLTGIAGELPHTIRYGTGKACDIRGELRSDFPHITFSWQKKGTAEAYEVNSGLSGAYNFENLLAAVCIGDHFGVLPGKIAEGIAAYVPRNNRSQELRRRDRLFILDAYNANPSSMAAALKNLEASPGDNKGKAAILGDMLELGGYAEEEHAAIVSLLGQMDLGHGYLIGPEFYKHRETAYRGASGSLVFFRDVPEAAAHFREQLPKENLILLKGSRGMRLEQLLECFPV